MACRQPCADSGFIRLTKPKISESQLFQPRGTTARECGRMWPSITVTRPLVLDNLLLLPCLGYSRPPNTHLTALLLSSGCCRGAGRHQNTITGGGQRRRARRSRGDTRPRSAVACRVHRRRRQPAHAGDANAAHPEPNLDVYRCLRSRLFP